MNPVSVDIKNLFVAQGFIVEAPPQTSTDWGGFIGKEPDKPDRTVTLYDTGGQPHYYLDKGHPPSNFENCQIRVRGLTYIETYEKIEELKNFIDGTKHRFDVVGDDTVHYSDILRNDEPQFLEQDDNARFVWVFNVTAYREKVTT